MLNMKLLELILLSSIICSCISISFVQKTKKYINKSKCIPIYNFFVSISVGVFFCNSFTNIVFPNCLWVGILSFLGSDTIYKTLEGKLLNHNSIRNSI